MKVVQLRKVLVTAAKQHKSKNETEIAAALEKLAHIIKSEDTRTVAALSKRIKTKLTS